MHRRPLLLSAFASVAAVSGCGSANSSGSGRRLNFSKLKRLAIQVSYSGGARPKENLGEVPVWDVFLAQLHALLEDCTFELQQDLVDFGQVPALHKREDLVEFSRRTRVVDSYWSGRHLHILFVSGQLDPSVGVLESLALALPDEAVIVVFVDPKGELPSGALALQQQLSLAHEVGHLMGLVNRDVPMRHNHEDPENSGHCSEDDCVMRPFATAPRDTIDALSSGTVPLLFGKECLLDLRSYYERT